MDRLTADLLIANKYGTVTGEKSFGVPNLSAQTFFKPIYNSLAKSDLTDPYRQHIWTYACINAKSIAIKRIPFLIIREEQKSGKKFKNVMADVRKMKSDQLYKIDRDFWIEKGFKVIEDGPVYDLFTRPNPFMVASQLWEYWMILMNLKGACLWVLDAGTDTNNAVKENELPKEIWPYSPEIMQADFDKTGTFIGWKKIKSISGEEKKFFKYQVMRFFKPDPNDIFSQVAPFDAVKKAASQDYKAEIFNEAIFDNGGFVGGFLKITDFIEDPEKRKMVMNEFNDKHQGVTKAGKWGLVQGGADILWNPNSHTDMQYMDGRKWNRDETVAGFGVPKMLISNYEDLQLATALVAHRTFLENQIIPECHYIEDMINSRLFNGQIKETQGLYCLFDLSGIEALRSDMDSKSQIAERLCRIGVPFNDVNKRLELGFDEYEWGKTWYMPINITPYGEEPEPDEKGIESGEDIYLTGIKTSTTHNIVRKAYKDKIRDNWIRRVFETIEPVFQKKLKTYWYELRKEQLQRWENATKAILKAMPTPEELEEVLFNNKEWQEKLSKSTKPMLSLSAQYSLEQLSDELGTVIGLDDPRVVYILQAKENKIVGITDRFWNRLKDSMSEGIKAGETPVDMSDRIRSVFNQVASPSRTLTIARTEIAQVASPVRHVGILSAGIKRHDWSDSKDEHTREDHVVLGGLAPVELMHNYMYDLGKQGIMLYPCYQGAPADQVINCRCVETADV